MPGALPVALIAILTLLGPGLGAAVAAGSDEGPFDPAAAEATIEFEALSPGDGELVTRETVVSARLRYAVGRFQPGQFVLVGRLAHREPRRTTSGGIPFNADLVLKEATGDLTLRLPLRPPWFAHDVAHPIVIWFQVHQIVRPGVTLPVASTEAVRYETDEPRTLPEDDELWNMGLPPADPDTITTPPTRVKYAKPRYPREAARGGLTGEVVAKTTIDAEGKVTDIEVIWGVPPLTDAALKAIRKWRYTPSQRGGEPVPTIITTTVNFRGPIPSVGNLLTAIRSKNEHIRAAAATNLGASAGIMSPRNRDKAENALDDLLEEEENDEVRTAALLALRRFGSH